MPCVLERDGLRLEFEVCELAKLDPQRELARSESPYDKVLGLLCVENASDVDWMEVCSAIRTSAKNNPELARDALALLLAVSTLISPSAQAQQILGTMAMRINIADSPVLQQLASRAEAKGALTLMKQIIQSRDEEINEADEEFLESLTLSDISELTARLLHGNDWSDIRPVGSHRRGPSGYD